MHVPSFAAMQPKVTRKLLKANKLFELDKDSALAKSGCCRQPNSTQFVRLAVILVIITLLLLFICYLNGIQLAAIWFLEAISGYVPDDQLNSNIFVWKFVTLTCFLLHLQHGFCRNGNSGCRECDWSGISDSFFGLYLGCWLFVRELPIARFLSIF
jgi:hypothetical protein